MSTVEKYIWHIEGGMRAGRRLDVPVHVQTPFLLAEIIIANLVVTAPGVSRHHLQIELGDNAIYVK